ncbi:hypothetical protein NQZ68_024626, partial [Dissostichus eleginoides]
MEETWRKRRGNVEETSLTHIKIFLSVHLVFWEPRGEKPHQQSPQWRLLVEQGHPMAARDTATATELQRRHPEISRHRLRSFPREIKSSMGECVAARQRTPLVCQLGGGFYGNDRGVMRTIGIVCDLDKMDAAPTLNKLKLITDALQWKWRSTLGRKVRKDVMTKRGDEETR